MPPPTQRRNDAYLNPLIELPAACTGLAIYLDGSLERRIRAADFAGEFGAPPQPPRAAITKGWSWRQSRSQRRDLCGLTNVRDFPVPKGHVSAKIEVCVHFQSPNEKGKST